MCPKNGGQYKVITARSRYGVFTGDTWGIHGVFMGYTYVSGKCRKKRGAIDEIYDNGDNWRGNQHHAALRGR